MTKAAQRKSPRKFNLTKLKAEMMRVQYFVQFIRVPNITIAINPSITIILRAFCCSGVRLTSTSESEFSPSTDSEIVKMPARQIKEPQTYRIVSLSL